MDDRGDEWEAERTFVGTQVGVRMCTHEDANAQCIRKLERDLPMSSRLDSNLYAHINQVAFKLKAVGHYQIKVEMLSEEYAAFTRGELICRYVRREIRDLFDDDRELFFNSIKTMQDMVAPTGQATYGNR